MTIIDPADGGKTGRSEIARKVEDVLAGPDFSGAVAALKLLPPRRALSALSAPMCNGEAEVRWRAASAAGSLIAALASRDPEAAANVMRRLMWNLNDESGNCAWGAAESMAEAMHQDEDLARGFAHILVAYIIPEGPFLEYEPLLRGAVWGIARVAERRPELVSHAVPYLSALLDSSDPGVRGLAARALGLLGGAAALPELERLFSDPAEYEDFEEGRALVVTVGESARAAAARPPRGAR